MLHLSKMEIITITTIHYTLLILNLLLELIVISRKRKKLTKLFEKKHMAKNIWAFGIKNITTFKIWNICPLIQCSCIRGLTNWTPNTRVYTVVVCVAYNQIAKFLCIQYGCISGLLTNHQIPAYTIWLYKRQTNKIPNFCIYNMAVYAAYKWLPNSRVYITTV